MNRRRTKWYLSTYLTYFSNNYWSDWSTIWLSNFFWLFWWLLFL